MADLIRSMTWDRDLQVYLDGQRDTDEPCATFASGAVIAMTGVDLTRKFRGRMAWVRDHLEEAVNEVLEPRPVPFARSGDVVMIGGNLGICYGDVSVFVALHEGQSGTTVVPTLTCDKAWTLG